MPLDSHSRLAGYARRLTWALLLAASAGLLASSFYRAATYAFTCDESLSFAGFTWEEVWSEPANNHLLNTWLMRVCSALFGNSELSLRLPNVLAHALYLAAGLALLKRFAHPVLMLSGFVLFNLNPFLLDFFSLARGYGLAMAFVMLSLYLLARAHEEKRRGEGFVKSVSLCAAAGSLALLSNFAFLNYHLPLLAACAWLLLTDASLRRLSRRHWRAALALLAASAMFLAFVVSQLLWLRSIGALYSGGSVGFIHDTVGTLVRSSLYLLYQPETYQRVSAMLVGLFVVLLLLGLSILASRKEVPLFVPLLLMLAAAVALPVAQHRLLGTLFPIDRAGLYYLPLYAAAVLSASQLLRRLSRGRWKRAAALVLPAALACGLGWHFQRSFNAHICLLWWFDANNDAALELIARDRELHFPGRPVRLGNSWMMEPSLNFYRVTRKYTWLEPVTRKPISVAEHDYVYAFENEVRELTAAGHTRLASYPDSQTVLLRVERGRAPNDSGLK